MRDLWNELSYWLSSCKTKNALEKEYENTIAQCLGFLGWKKYIGEITTQYPIQVGHETKLADIVVSLNGVEQFVIEVKRPGHTIQPEDERQLVSYMRLAKHPVKFGLYIGDEIRLYYDDGNTFPEVIFCVDITSNNSDGERFVELFHRNTFDCIKLKDYCEKILNKRIREKALDTVLSTFCSEYGETVLKELLTEHLMQKGFAKCLVDEKIENIKISISPKNIKYTNEDKTPTCDRSKSSDSEISINGSKKHRSYSLNGIICRKPAELAFFIVKKYIADNPTLTFEEVRSKLNKYVIILSEKEFSIKKDQSADKDFERRWLYKPDAKLQSSDKVVFMVQTGWNYWGYNDSRPANICNLIDFAQKQGYDVQEL